MAQKKRYKITKYSTDEFVSIMTSTSTRGELVASRSLLKYFDKYLRHIKAKTIIVEFGYIDRDFLEDYSSYYIRCFTNYERRCIRLHFFGESISPRYFSSLLNGKQGADEEKLLSSYLGFIVKKPLPLTVFRRTCLRTYTEGDGRRFPITRDYHANLFGIKLTAKNTIAFQGTVANHPHPTPK